MATERRLRVRLARPLVVTAIAISLLLPFTFWLTDTQLEGAAREDLLTFRLLELVRTDERPFVTDTGRSTIAYYRPALFAVPELPPAFKDLPPGNYKEVRYEGKVFAVHIRDVRAKDRAYLSYEVGFIERLESSMWMFIMALAGLVVLAARVFAQSIVDRALQPFSSLVEQIQSLKPGGQQQLPELDDADYELAIIIDSFNRYLAEIDLLVERERSFAAAASHELRTPLTVIQGAVRIIGETATPSLKVRERLGRATQELAQDLDALLLLSQREIDQPTEPIWLNTWLPELTERHIEAVSGACTVKWSIHKAVHVVAQPGAVNVVYGNLLRNAVRAAGSGEIGIEIHDTHVAILDSGPGIPPEELPLVFEPRFRGHDGGSGMGLYIASTLAARHGWTLELFNRPEGGACALWRFETERPAN